MANSRKLLSAFLLAVLAFTLAGFAQTPAPTPAVSLSDSWVGIQANYDTFASPHMLAGLLAAKRLVGTDTSQLATYGITELNFQGYGVKPRGAFVTTLRFGVAEKVVTIGQLDLLAIADLGFGTSGASTVSSFSGGFGAFYRFKKSHFVDGIGGGVTADRLGTINGAQQGVFSNYHITLLKCIGKCD